ncbi:MAG: CRISPR-associated endonuclease Cas1, partial [Gammaproteobacteria bacterium]
AFGKAVVRAKILAQTQVQQAYAKNYLAETLGESHRILAEMLERLEQVGTLEELRGVEGTASRAYFDLFRRWNRSEISFDGRSKRGALDPINAVGAPVQDAPPCAGRDAPSPGIDSFGFPRAAAGSGRQEGRAPARVSARRNARA